MENLSQSDGVDFVSLYTTKSATPQSATPPHRSNGSSSLSHLSFSPSPTKPEDVDLRGKSFCNRNNVDDCIAHLNSELTVLGFLTLYDSASATFDIVKLINITYELLKRHRHSRRIREELEYRERRSQSDRKHLQNVSDKYKANLEQCQRVADQLNERERQLLIKNKATATKLESKKEEVKRLQVTIQQRDAQYKHEMKKKERELVKLKDKMHQLLTDKNGDKCAGLDIINTLQRSDGKRSTWKIGTHNKQEEEMYRLIIVNYEEKQKELLVENQDLRKCVQQTQEYLTSLVNHNSPHNSQVSEDAPEMSEDETDLMSEASHSPQQISQGHYELPYEMFSQKLEKSLKEMCKQIKDNLQKAEKVSDIKEISVFEDLEEENSLYKRKCEKMTEELVECKTIMERQQELLQRFHEQQQHQQQSEPDRTTRCSSEVFLEEQELAEERRLLAEQMAKFEDDKRRFTEAVIQFGIDKSTFTEEKSSFLINEFMSITPFKDPKTGHKPAQVADKRLLPPTPGFLNMTSRKNRKLPSTPELFHVLGLIDTENGLCTPATNQKARRSKTIHQSGISSKHTPARVAEHMENIKMTLFQKTNAANSQKTSDATTD